MTQLAKQSRRFLRLARGRMSEFGVEGLGFRVGFLRVEGLRSTFPGLSRLRGGKWGLYGLP